MNSKVIILLTTYNRCHLIAETIKSIQNQTYPDFECFITDDNSTDDTEQVVQGFCKSDKRFKYFKKPSNYEKGLPENRNFGLDLAEHHKASYIQFFDDDDIMHPQKLERQLKVFREFPDTEIVNCKYQGFIETLDNNTELGKESMNIHTENLAEDFLFRSIRVHTEGPLFKAYILANIRFDKELKFYAEEEEFYLRLFFFKRPVYRTVDDFLFYYRHHKISVTASKENELQKMGTTIRVRQKIWVLLQKNALLSRKTIAYFLKYFLLDHYSPEYIREVQNYVKESNTVNRLEKIKYQFIVNFHRFYRKFIYKILQ